jgi:hypothetical protein
MNADGSARTPSPKRIRLAAGSQSVRTASRARRSSEAMLETRRRVVAPASGIPLWSGVARATARVSASSSVAVREEIRIPDLQGCRSSIAVGVAMWTTS